MPITNNYPQLAAQYSAVKAKNDATLKQLMEQLVRDVAESEAVFARVIASEAAINQILPLP